ncbi:MAG: DUF4402 domain-containing protein [Melioribacteraceae bacterium]|nr:DUF4402 domain-containing protein [Melioribacteraceae bacterium]
MKIGKVIAVLLLSNILVCSIALGQSNGTTTANVSITIVKALQVNQIQGDLAFGNLVQSGVSTKVERTPDKGILFEVSGSAGRNIVVDYQNTLLNNQSVETNNNSIQFIPEVNHTYSNSNYNNPKTVLSGGSYQLSEKDGDGYLYLWIGGEMNINSELPSGSYSGAFAVTVSY